MILDFSSATHAGQTSRRRSARRRVSFGESAPADTLAAASPSVTSDGKQNEHSSAASATLTGPPAAYASAPILRFSARSSVAATIRNAPAPSEVSHFFL